MINDHLSGSGVSPSQTTRLDSTVINRLQVSLFKVIKSGNIVEIYKYEKPIIKGMPSRNKGKKRKKLEKPSERSEEYKQRSAQRGRTVIRRLVSSNFSSESKFVTLTFEDTNQFDITSLNTCQKIFANFSRKLRLQYPELKYICVPEFQDKYFRGAVHFHLVTNLPYFEKEKLWKLWGYGFVRINRHYKRRKNAAYLSKYLNKHAFDPRFYGKRKFYTSRNLRKPVEIFGSEAEDLVLKLSRKTIKPRFQNSYFSQFNGQVEFTEYNLATAQNEKNHE